MGWVGSGASEVRVGPLSLALGELTVRQGTYGGGEAPVPGGVQAEAGWHLEESSAYGEGG